MGLYELFVSNLDIAKLLPEEKYEQRSNLFGLFTLQVSLSFIYNAGKTHLYIVLWMEFMKGHILYYFPSSLQRKDLKWVILLCRLTYMHIFGKHVTDVSKQ